MIYTTNETANYLTRVTNGEHVVYADTTFEKGGKDRGFRPHELLEAALASCMNMAVRMRAAQYGIPLSRLSVKVALNRENADEATFEYQIELPENLTDNQKELLLTASENCPVRRTLSMPLCFIPNRILDGTMTEQL